MTADIGVTALMYRVVCTTSLVFSVTPLERGPLHNDKNRVMGLAAWLRRQGQEALVQESPSGRCFDESGKHVGTSPMPIVRAGTSTAGFGT